MLGSVFLVAAASCGNKEPEWTSGADSGGRKHDTTSNGHIYRYYGGGWYPVYTNGMICPGAYSRPFSYQQITTPGFKPPAVAVPMSGGGSSHVTTGGFGGSEGASGAGE